MDGTGWLCGGYQGGAWADIQPLFFFPIHHQRQRPPQNKTFEKKAYDNPAETLQRIKRQLLVTRHFKEVRGLTRWMMRRMTE